MNRMNSSSGNSGNSGTFGMNGSSGGTNGNNGSNGGNNGSSGGNNGSSGEESYTVADAALVLDIPQRSLRQWIKEGGVPVIPPLIGQRGQRIPAATIREILANSPGAREQGTDDESQNTSVSISAPYPLSSPSAAGNSSSGSNGNSGNSSSGGSSGSSNGGSSGSNGNSGNNGSSNGNSGNNGSNGNAEIVQDSGEILGSMRQALRRHARLRREEVRRYQDELAHRDEELTFLKERLIQAERESRE